MTGVYIYSTLAWPKGAAGQMSTVREGESSFSLTAFTHEYAPIEQLQDAGTQPVGDVYALGATLYHLLTGQSPVAATKRDEAIQRDLSDPLRPAHQVNPAISPRCFPDYFTSHDDPLVGSDGFSERDARSVNTRRERN